MSMYHILANLHQCHEPMLGFPVSHTRMHTTSRSLQLSHPPQHPPAGVAVLVKLQYACPGLVPEQCAVLFCGGSSPWLPGHHASATSVPGIKPRMLPVTRQSALPQVSQEPLNPLIGRDCRMYATSTPM